MHCPALIINTDATIKPSPVSSGFRCETRKATASLKLKHAQNHKFNPTESRNTGEKMHIQREH